MAKQAKTSPASQPTDDALAGSIDRLAAELGLLRDVLDSLREDFSWVTRNGLPVQLIEQSLRMPDATAGAGLSAEEGTRHEVVDGIVASVEAIAQGQLEVVLAVLDGIQQQILAAVERRSTHRKEVATTDSRDERDAGDTGKPVDEGSRAVPPGRGRLF